MIDKPQNRYLVFMVNPSLWHSYKKTKTNYVLPLFAVLVRILDFMNDLIFIEVLLLLRI